MPRRTTAPDPQPEPGFTSIPEAPDETLPEEEAKTVEDEKKKPVFASDPFISLKGKLYLPARRRVQWFRGEPVVHPDWTIDTDIVEHERGTRTSSSRVEGGYALVRASIYDTDGRLIATSVKSEFSENFMDFLEKAETGAIARALALCGYGTESAVDLDEGIGENGEPRIADSPVAVTRSEVPNVGRGGKSTTTTDAQVREVARQAARLGMDAPGVANVIRGILPSAEVPAMSEDHAEASKTLRDFLGSLSPEDIVFIIDVMDKAGRAEDHMKETRGR
jgi:hypothetical protein